jgi:ribosome-associated protein
MASSNDQTQSPAIPASRYFGCKFAAWMLRERRTAENIFSTPRGLAAVMEFALEDTAYIELCDLLKVTGLCASGGEAKGLIADGEVKVDGQVELRKRCKIRHGQRVEFAGHEIVVA